MNLILLGVIQLYWHLIPGQKRRHCLFRESCSRYVYRISKEKGFFSGCAALTDRIKKCRPGYELVKNGDSFQLRLKDGAIVLEEDIALSILPFNDSVTITEITKRKVRNRHSKRLLK
jgi:putative component of membrane protein insertase Oxa1/YidC/SpoIIIJ protein YidD